MKGDDELTLYTIGRPREGTYAAEKALCHGWRILTSLPGCPVGLRLPLSARLARSRQMESQQ